MPDQTPATELRAAAEKLRAAATADYVTPGPWIVHKANGFLRVDQPGPPSKAWTEKTGADLAEENRGTAEYIALMHPGVGLALADWLDAMSLDHDLDREHDGCDRTICPSAAALKLARELLGEVTQ